MASKTLLLLGACAMAALAQQKTFIAIADANGDGTITKEEFKAATAKWLPQGSATEEQLVSTLDPQFPQSSLGSMLRARGPQNQTPKPADVEKMMAALPSKAPATPKKPRKVLVLSKAAGFVHSCIPLAAKTVEELGNKTGAWTTTVSYDAAVITAENLKQYDLVFLNNTTGAFLDDADANVTAARKKALLDFVRSGKGIAGIHAASDSYHEPGPQAPGMGATFAAPIVSGADKDKDKKVSAAELAAYSDVVFDKMDTEKTGKLAVADVRSKILFAVLSSGVRGGGGAPRPARGKQGPDYQVGTWPEFNKMIGGYFKYHWFDPTKIVYKIDDPNSPLTVMFKGSEFSLEDETYTFAANSWSRKNLHVLTSVDYSKMPEADRVKEDFPREDHDYGLSWVRREGKGRLFYEAHGHNEKIYAIPQMLEHLLAGMQYALGDLKANDAPSVK